MTADQLHPTWIAFLDLLGTKDSASLSDYDLMKSQDQFHSHIAAFSCYLSSDCKIYPFGDCCYIEFASLKDFITFFQKLRYELFSQGFYFKCAVAEGSLGYESVSRTSRRNRMQQQAISTISDDKAKAAQLMPKVRGGKFGHDVVSVYRAHEAFKGIGCYLVKPARLEAGVNDPRNFCYEDFESSKENIVTSCFIEELVGRSGTFKYIEYLDIRYGDYEVSSNYDVLTTDEIENVAAYCRQLVKSALSAKLKKHSYGKYYVSAIISMVESSDFERVSYVDKNWLGAPAIFEQLFGQRKLISALSDLPGIEVAYYLCITKAWHLLEEVGKSELIRTLVTHPWLVKRVGMIPRKFLKPQLQNELVTRLSVQQMTPHSSENSRRNGAA